MVPTAKKAQASGNSKNNYSKAELSTYKWIRYMTHAGDRWEKAMPFTDDEAFEIAIWGDGDVVENLGSDDSA